MSPAIARVVFWAATLSCAVAQAALIRSVLSTAAAGRYPEDRRKRSRRAGMRWGPDRRATPTDDPSPSSRELEIGWAVLPALALAALLVATWFALPD